MKSSLHHNGIKAAKTINPDNATCGGNGYLPSISLPIQVVLFLFYSTLLNVACKSRINMDIEVSDEGKPEINSGGMFKLYANHEVM